MWSVALRRINKFVESGAYLPTDLLKKYLDAGAIDQKDIELFKNLMKQFRGNTDTVLEAMRAYDKDGFVKVWELVQPDAELFNYMSDTGMLSGMMDAQRATSPSEFLKLSTLLNPSGNHGQQRSIDNLIDVSGAGLDLDLAFRNQIHHSRVIPESHTMALREPISDLFQLENDDVLYCLRLDRVVGHKAHRCQQGGLELLAEARVNGILDLVGLRRDGLTRKGRNPVRHEIASQEN